MLINKSKILNERTNDCSHILNRLQDNLSTDIFLFRLQRYFRYPDKKGGKLNSLTDKCAFMNFYLRTLKDLPKLKKFRSHFKQISFAEYVRIIIHFCLSIMYSLYKMAATSMLPKQLQNKSSNTENGFSDILKIQRIGNNNQYFTLPHFYPPDKNEVFLDCGCFDGRTSVLFERYCDGGYDRIIAFEPSPINYERCLLVLKDYPNTTIISSGIDMNPGQINFSANLGGSSRINLDSDLTVPVTTLDIECAHERVTFIKMDIEGMELRALQGAKEIIKNNKPKLAICVYHELEDIYTIPEYLLSLCGDYKFWLRHYSVGHSEETVLYAM